MSIGLHPLFNKLLILDSVGSNSDYGLGVSLSEWGGVNGEYLFFDFLPSCKREGVWFKDMTGDGRHVFTHGKTHLEALTRYRADFCCVGPDGGVVCWQNTAGSDARSPAWVSMGTVKASEGYPQAQVRLISTLRVASIGLGLTANKFVRSALRILTETAERSKIDHGFVYMTCMLTYVVMSFLTQTPRTSTAGEMALSRTVHPSIGTKWMESSPDYRLTAFLDGALWT